MARDPAVIDAWLEAISGEPTPTNPQEESLARVTAKATALPSAKTVGGQTYSEILDRIKSMMEAKAPTEKAGKVTSAAMGGARSLGNLAISAGRLGMLLSPSRGEPALQEAMFDRPQQFLQEATEPYKAANPYSFLGGELVAQVPAFMAGGGALKATGAMGPGSKFAQFAAGHRKLAKGAQIAGDVAATYPFTSGTPYERATQMAGAAIGGQALRPVARGVASRFGGTGIGRLLSKDVGSMFQRTPPVAGAPIGAAYPTANTANAPYIKGYLDQPPPVDYPWGQQPPPFSEVIPPIEPPTQPIPLGPRQVPQLQAPAPVEQPFGRPVPPYTEMRQPMEIPPSTEYPFGRPPTPLSELPATPTQSRVIPIGEQSPRPWQEMVVTPEEQAAAFAPSSQARVAPEYQTNIDKTKTGIADALAAREAQRGEFQGVAEELLQDVHPEVKAQAMPAIAKAVEAADLATTEEAKAKAIATIVKNVEKAKAAKTPVAKAPARPTTEEANEANLRGILERETQGPAQAPGDPRLLAAIDQASNADDLPSLAKIHAEAARRGDNAVVARVEATIKNKLVSSGEYGPEDADAVVAAMRGEPLGEGVASPPSATNLGGAAQAMPEGFSVVEPARPHQYAPGSAVSRLQNPDIAPGLEALKLHMRGGQWAEQVEDLLAAVQAGNPIDDVVASNLLKRGLATRAKNPLWMKGIYQKDPAAYKAIKRMFDSLGKEDVLTPKRGVIPVSADPTPELTAASDRVLGEGLQGQARVDASRMSMDVINEGYKDPDSWAREMMRRTDNGYTMPQLEDLWTEITGGSPPNPTRPTGGGGATRLEWLREAFKDANKTFGRIMNDIDAAQYKDLLENDPLVKKLEVINPELAARARSGDITLEELRKVLSDFPSRVAPHKGTKAYRDRGKALPTSREEIVNRGRELVAEGPKKAGPTGVPPAADTSNVTPMFPSKSAITQDDAAILAGLKDRHASYSNQWKIAAKELEDEIETTPQANYDSRLVQRRWKLASEHLDKLLDRMMELDVRINELEPKD